MTASQPLQATLNSTLGAVERLLLQLAGCPDYGAILEASFGTAPDPERFRQLIAALPAVEIRAAGELGAALGGYGLETATVYLDERLFDPANAGVDPATPSQLLRVLLDERKLELQLDTDALDWLAEVGYDPVYGARPLKRAIHRELETPIAKAILAGSFAPGATIDGAVEGEGESAKLRLQPAEPASLPALV